MAWGLELQVGSSRGVQPALHPAESGLASESTEKESSPRYTHILFCFFREPRSIHTLILSVSLTVTCIPAALQVEGTNTAEETSIKRF